MVLHHAREKVARDNEIGAKRDVLDSIFNDMYRSRRLIYKINFFRGIFFGLGSVLGGTVVVALIVWTLSFFVNIPGVQFLQHNIENSQRTK